MKITYMGQPVRDTRGRFARKHWLTALILIGLVAMFLAIFNVAFGTQVDATNTMSLLVTPAFASETDAAKIDQLKEKVIDEMVACENPSHMLVWPDDNAAGTLPRKDKVSIGDLAFKISTVQRFYKALNGKDLSDREAMTLALDTPQARALALNAWINIKGSINEWSCVTQEMKTQIEDIRFLTN